MPIPAELALTKEQLDELMTSSWNMRVASIGPGTRIRVTTRRGSIELKARSDSAVAPGMVFIPFCYAEAAANVLTNPQLDPFGKIPEYKYCAAKVEPLDRRAAAE